jgi:hypothetical protein
LVGTALEPERDADPHFRHARVRRPRKRLRFAHARPLLAFAPGADHAGSSSITDLLVVASFAAGGLLMSPLPIRVIALLVATTILFTLAMDSIKLAVFARVRID